MEDVTGHMRLDPRIEGLILEDPKTEDLKCGIMRKGEIGPLRMPGTSGNGFRSGILSIFSLKPESACCLSRRLSSTSHESISPS